MTPCSYFSETVHKNLSKTHLLTRQSSVALENLPVFLQIFLTSNVVYSYMLQTMRSKSFRWRSHEYFNFIKGVDSSEDWPLYIFLEALQQNKSLQEFNEEIFGNQFINLFALFVCTSQLIVDVYKLNESE